MAAAKHDSVDDALAASDREEAHHPYSRADEVPSIFLCHSGKEKAFVKHLYDALKSANYTAFFDDHTLLPSSPLAPRINRAVLHGCKLGVVVLSDDFLTSKWPMLELETLVLQRSPKATVLPLFYSLSPSDLKSHQNLSKWRRVWKEKASQDADRWEQAVKAILSFNGVVFDQGTSETDYIQRVVHLICNLVPRPISNDLSSILGHERFAQVVASEFEEAARQRDKVCKVGLYGEGGMGKTTMCMVGLYGEGGIGKTTMCKIMTNFYNAHYLGKSYHIEFPSDGDEMKIVRECTKALKKLTNHSELLLNDADSFDEVIQVMRQNLKQYDVFLAIDNVWESSLEAARRILLGVSCNSKILLTSRSEEVLTDLLWGHSNSSTLGPLPSLTQEEAFQLFEETSELGGLNFLVNRYLLDNVLWRCIFDRPHALALKALGQYVKRVCALEGFDKIEHRLSHIVKGIEEKTHVQDLILLNYADLAAEKKHMFLDIVTVVGLDATYAVAHLWLSTLYKEFSKSKITSIIYELASDGLIQLENIDDKSAEKMIRVHDLYSDLAQREAARSARFLTDGSTRSVKEIEWERLERVILRERYLSSHFIEELQQQECRKLQVLCAENIDFTSGIQLDLMPSLCVLDLKRGTLRSVKSWSAATGLSIVRLAGLECAPPLEPIPSIPCLEELIIEDVKTAEGSPNLDGCQHLKKLVLAEASVFKNWKACYFSSLTNLQSLQIEHFNSITRVLNLDGVVNLQFLRIQRCESVERIEGHDALKNLQSLYVDECPCLRNLDGLSGLLQLEGIFVRNADLKKMPDLSGLTCLESLVLYDNKSMEKVVGGLSPALKQVVVRGCDALKRMPDVSGLTFLESLVLYDNTSMEEVVGGLSLALKKVVVRGCEALKRMSDLSGLTSLESLVLYDNKSMEEVVGGLSPALKYVVVRGCKALKRMPDLRGLTCLELLKLHDNKSMEEVVGGLSPALKNVKVRGCEALKRMPDLRGLTCLESLVLYDNKSMEEVVGGLSPAIKKVVVRGCEALKRMPDLSGLTCLESLVLYDIKSMEEVVGRLSPALEYVEVRGCEALKRMPDLRGLTCLKRLELHDNKSMEEVVGGLSPTLRKVEVRGCEALKRMPDLSGLTCLEILEVHDNKSIEEVVGGLSPALMNVKVCGCEALKRMPDLRGLTCLTWLKLQDNKSMEEVVGGLSPFLKNVEVHGCEALKRMPDLRKL